MKHLPFLFLLFIAACADKNTDPLLAPTRSAVISSEASAFFEITSEKTDAEIDAEASAALKAGKKISVEKAERCLRQQSARPHFQELCLLLSSGRQEKSEILDQALRNGAIRSAPTAIALAWQPSAAAGLPIEELRKVMKLLESYPAGLRLALANAWMNRERAGYLAEFKGWLSAGSNLDELAAYFRFWRSYDFAYYLSEAGRYCQPDALEESSWRCLRLRGALGEATPVPELNHGGSLTATQDFLRNYSAFSPILSPEVR